MLYLGTDEHGAKLELAPEDLRTHAVIVGMTGSGKTGLGIALLEEAALAGIPVLALDPKGDLCDRALVFPDLSPAAFAPWCRDPETVAAQWQAGLGAQKPRLAALKAAQAVEIYTPGAAGGRALSLLANLKVPAAEGMAEAVAATASALLTLICAEADPLSGPHALTAAILRTSWSAGQDLDLPRLIALTLNPPFARLGVLAVDEVCNAATRKKLAAAWNNLLLSPRFATWKQGAALSAEGLFYDAQGRPQTAILHLAALNDDERMFLVTLLLAELIRWMRRQSGTSGLRALLYMDEIVGFLPPNAAPPSKALFLTLLKQARAVGLGLVLSSQNPIDLDYKALSNAGLWCIGRLQTAQDAARLAQGLRRDPSLLAQLRARQFLLHNVHAAGERLFTTRFCLSYLAGPLTSAQLAQLVPPEPEPEPTPLPAVLPAPGIAVHYAAAAERAFVLAEVELFFADQASGIRQERRYSLKAPFDAQGNPIWAEAEAFDAQGCTRTPPHTPRGPAPDTIAQAQAWKTWEARLRAHLRHFEVLHFWYCPRLDCFSEPEEEAEAFRTRLSAAAAAARAAEKDALREEFAQQAEKIEHELTRAEQRLEKEEREGQQSWLEAGISFGGMLLSVFTGRKLNSARNIRAASSALRRASRVKKERDDVKAAQEVYAECLAKKEALAAAEASALAAVDAAPPLALVAKTCTAQSRDIHILSLSLLWA